MSSIPINQSNLNEQNRIKFVTDLAAVSRGKDESKNPERRYHALLKEAAPTCAEITMLSDGEKPKGSPSRPLEFLPVVVDILPDYHNNQAAFTLWAVDATEEDNSIKEFNDLSDAMGLLKYSHVSRHPTDKHLMRVYTNMRALINAGIPYEKIPYNKSEDLESFVAIKANIPMFVWAQVPNTHTQISKEAQSDRVAENNSYWLPSDFRDRLFHLTKDGTKTGKAIDPEATIGWQGVYQLQDGTKIGKVAQYLLTCTTHEELVQEILALSQIESQNLS